MQTKQTVLARNSETTEASVDFEIQELRQLSFFRDQAVAAFEQGSLESRLEYRELDLVPVREVNELATLRLQTEALQDAANRLKYMIGEISYLLKK